MVKQNQSEAERMTETTKQYINAMEQLAKKIERTKPRDRLEYSVATAFLLNAIGSSIKGWDSWMSSLDSINSLSLADWKESYPKMSKLAVKWIRLDLHITKKKMVEATIKLKELKKKLKKHGKKVDKTTYVA